MIDSWREFEQLVMRIEKQLVPKGAVVKSPDWIEDKVTGQLREVDASIRYRVGSVPILITIECRKRDRVQDDTWIEQLASKREKIGALQTIAVTSSDFTVSAKKSAKHYEIELRRIKDITDSEISRWIEGMTIQRVNVFDSVENWTIETDGESTNFSEEIEEALRESYHHGKVIFRSSDDLPLSMNDLVNTFYRWLHEGHLSRDSYAGLEGDDNFVKRRLVFNFTPGTFYTITRTGRANVLEASIDLKTKIDREPILLSKVYQYLDMEGEISQIAVGSFSMGERPEDKVQIFVQPAKE